MPRAKRTDVIKPKAPVTPEPPPEPSKTVSRREDLPTEISDFDVIDGFVLENHDKLQRVLEGDVMTQGLPQGGLIEKYGDISKVPPSEVLARYDKIGGLITKDIGSDVRVKIKTGSFWDVRKKAPREEPMVKYLFIVGGEKVEVDDPSELAKALTTIEKTRSAKDRENAERRARAKQKSITRNKDK